jgi:hypothetical protein
VGLLRIRKVIMKSSGCMETGQFFAMIEDSKQFVQKMIAHLRNTDDLKESESIKRLIDDVMDFMSNVG